MAPAPGGAPDEPPSEEEASAAPQDPEPHAEALAALMPGEGAVSFAEASRIRSAQRRAVAAQVAEARRSLRAGAKAIARAVSLEAPVTVVANSVALPGWAQDVHETHHPILVGGVVACVRCSSIVATRATGTALARACPGVMQPGNASRLKRICQGKLPHQLAAWPDGLAEPGESRPVAPLVRALGAWTFGTEGDLVVAQRRREVSASARLASAARAVRSQAVLGLGRGSSAARSASLP